MKKTNPLKTVIQGSIMGIVETIPGVSGSTLALIMGIYDDFIGVLHDVSSVFKEVIKFVTGKSSKKKVISIIYKINRRFATFLFFGMLLGIGVFSHIMSFLLDHYPTYTFAFFFGLILASIRVPWSQIKRLNDKVLAIMVLSFIVMFLVLGIKPAAAAENPSAILLFVGGAFAICSMILPGVSGSFVLLLFGLYDYVISAVKELTTLGASSDQFVSLVILGFGVLVGFGSFVRVLKKGLDKSRSEIMAFLIGLMLASLRTLWPFMDTSSAESVEFYSKVMPWQVPSTEAMGLVLISLVTMLAVTYLDKKVLNNS